MSALYHKMWCKYVILCVHGHAGGDLVLLGALTVAMQFTTRLKALQIDCTYKAC